MAYVEAEGQSLLYTGDFKLHTSLAAEPCEPRPADVLIMETTFGRPHFQFPSPAEVWAAIIQFCRQTLAEGATPVLLGYPLGKSQELLCGLAAAGLPVTSHPKVHEMACIYAEFSPDFPVGALFHAEHARGSVLVFPPGRRNWARAAQWGPVRTAICTGWAIDPACRFRYGADAAFPLSDHADFPELLELVRQVAPGKVYTLHGFAADFAQSLRDLGVDAQALSEPDQLHLRLFGA